MSTVEFHKSIGSELLAMKDRVRNLVSHWGEDGRYKEAILKTVIKRFLPEQFAISSGFVVRQTANRGQHESSKQIDLIIYDTGYPVLFKEGDFVIVTPDSVRAIIEVKTNLRSDQLVKVVKKACEVGKFIFDGKGDKQSSLFNGVFSFEGNRAIRIGAVRNKITNACVELVNEQGFDRFSVNHISFNEDAFLKYWPNEQVGERYRLYTIQGLSFSFFIGNLMNSLTRDSVFQNNSLWFPVDKAMHVHVAP